MLNCFDNINATQAGQLLKHMHLATKQMQPLLWLSAPISIDVLEGLHCWSNFLQARPLQQARYVRFSCCHVLFWNFILFTIYLYLCCLVCTGECICLEASRVDHNDGPFFSAMEWLMFFFRPPLTTMVFQWFYHHWTITIECFWRVQPLVSMVFQWFLKFWGRWLTMVCMYHCTKKCAKSIRDKMQNHRNNIFRTPIHWNLTYSTTEKRLPNIHFLRNAKKCAQISHFTLCFNECGNEYQGRMAVAS